MKVTITGTADSFAVDKQKALALTAVTFKVDGLVDVTQTGRVERVHTKNGRNGIVRRTFTIER